MVVIDCILGFGKTLYYQNHTMANAWFVALVKIVTLIPFLKYIESLSLERLLPRQFESFIINCILILPCYWEIAHKTN